MRNIFKKPFTITILSIFVLEILSFAGWFYSGFGNIVMAIIVATVLFVSLKSLKHGMAIVLAELIIGSHGYLFSIQQAGFPVVSLRIGLFIAVFLAFLWHVAKKKKINIISSSIFKYLVIFAGFVALAMLYGAINNGAGIAFADGNGYVYFLLAFPLWQAFNKFEDLKLLLEVSMAAILMISLKGLAILYIFSHFLTFGPIMPGIYRWVRDTRVGEITQNEQTEVFFRIFFAGHVWIAIAFVASFVFWLAYLNANKLSGLYKTKRFWGYISFITIILTSTLVSLSRSNWLGLVITAGVWLVLFFVISKHPWQRVLQSVVSSSIFLGASALLVTSIILFPFPATQGGFSAGDLFKSRVSNLTGGEAAIDSREQLLPPMIQAVKNNPVIGYGFGKQLTYITEDPRIREQNPSGEYTTYAFEWGYLELWIKLGGLGLLSYLAFIVVLFRDSLKMLLNKRKQHFENYDYWNLAFFLGAITLVSTHMFSPYLNHPLGIGYLVLWTLIIELTKRQKALKIKAI